MRCPKCQYIGFDDPSRCRNCGYDFSLLQAAPSMDVPIDLPIRENEPLGPMVDLGLNAATRRRGAAATATPPPIDQTAAVRRTLTPQGLDLPLFDDGGDDRPLVSVPAIPRQPLAVRRAAPVTPRARVDEPTVDEPELAFPEPVRRVEQDASTHSLSVAHQSGEGSETLATAGRRISGAAVDAAIIGSIDTAVIYFTLRICGLAPAEIRLLPVVPLVAFLLMLNGGYLTMFTAAGGQTIGKMIAGTKVASAAATEGPGRVSFGTALVRAAMCFVSVLPAGAGFLMALFRADGRALHDAVADTRVIRA